MATRPVSLTRATLLCWALVGLGAVTTALTAVLRDSLIRSWAEGRPDVRRVLQTRGLEAVKSGTVQVPAFVPVAIVLFVVMAGLIWVLLALVGSGVGWARGALSLLLVLLAVGTVSGLRTGPPATFVVLSLASLPIEAAAV